MITGYFGVPGCGKTTLATMKARKLNKQIKRDIKRVAKGKKKKCKYDYVLTNFECKGCYKINFTDIGIYDIQNCAIILDELTIDADNRDFKNFARSSVEGFIYHRHYFNDIYYYTQNFQAVDKKIRDLTHTLYFVKKSQLFPFSLFTKAKIIYRTIDINEYTKEIVNGYRFPNLFENILDMLGILKLGEICFRPLYYKDFDSFSQPLELKPFTYEKW
ncbi:MAG: hypothetical protein IJA43_08850 [Clostridia bacterium]|nr:hypothetical protein [Clostridia bacterium]